MPEPGPVPGSHKLVSLGAAKTKNRQTQNNNLKALSYNRNEFLIRISPCINMILFEKTYMHSYFASITPKENKREKPRLGIQHKKHTKNTKFKD